MTSYEWRGAFESPEVNTPHAEGFDHDPLVGFGNVAWDGAVHAFLLDTLVTATEGRQGVGRRLVATAVDNARTAGCEWLHVDFDDHLKPFYVDGCGFQPTNAGLIAP